MDNQGKLFEASDEIWLVRYGAQKKVIKGKCRVCNAIIKVYHNFKRIGTVEMNLRGKPCPKCGRGCVLID